MSPAAQGGWRDSSPTGIEAERLAAKAGAEHHVGYELTQAGSRLVDVRARKAGGRRYQAVLSAQADLLTADYRRY